MKQTKQLRLVYAALCATLFCVGAAYAGQTTRVSVGSNGVQGNQKSVGGISADGNYIVFISEATNLVANDTNGFADVFVRNLQTGTTSRVSVASDGTQANELSISASISGDGRYVTFLSQATNLAPNDISYLPDVFVHDRQTGSTSLVDVSSSGEQSNSYNDQPVISANGRYVAFQSYATNLVTGDTNDIADIFMRDLQTRTTTRVSVASNGEQGIGSRGASRPILSPDGRYVAFLSEARDLVPGDTNRSGDTFLHDRQTRTTTRVSVKSNGAQTQGGVPIAITPNGRYVVFDSQSPRIVPDDTSEDNDTFVRDMQTGVVTRVTATNSTGVFGLINYGMAISADGRYVTFLSNVPNLVPGDTNTDYDIFIRDRQTGILTRVILTDNSVEANADIDSASISADWRYIAFNSKATNLVSNDTNNASDVFVRDRVGDIPVSLAVDNARTFAEGSAGNPGSTTFTVQLMGQAFLPVTVNYQTTNNTAKAGSDYVAKSGTLTFAPGETSKFVKVNYIGDDMAELAETFFLDLNTPDGATIADSRGSAYIRNDDGPGIVINNALTVNEGNNGTRAQTFQVLLGAASSNIVTVDWATANGTAGPADYTVASGKLTFAPGETSKTITILIKGDTTVEVNETYMVNLSNPTYAVLADSQGIGYIRNDDAAALKFEDEPSQ